MRWLICLLTALAMLVSACGNWGLNKKTNIAIVDWQKAMESHPQYEKLQRYAQELHRAEKMRDEQKALGMQQLSLIKKMMQLKQGGQANFMQAEYTTKMLERETVNRDRLRKLEAKLDGEAEQYVIAERHKVEEVYRLPIINLRLKLENVRMTVSARQAVEKELQDILAARSHAMAVVEAKKQDYINQKLRPEIEKNNKELDEYAKQLTGEYMKKGLGIKDSDRARLKQGPAEFDKLMASLDKQVNQKGADYDTLEASMSSDINSAITKIALTKKYSLVVRDVRANITATDITNSVINELKNIAK